MPSLSVSPNFKGFPGHFYMDSAWRVRMVSLDEHIFYFVLSGSIEATVNGDRISLNPGEAAIMPPGLQFFYRSTNDAAIELYRFRLTITPRGKTIPALRDFYHASAPGSREYFMRIIQEGEFPTQGGEWKTKGLLIALLAEVFFHKLSKTSERMLTASEIRTLRSYLLRQAPRWPRPAELARELQLSADYFTRLFRRSMGMPPRRWIVEERVRMAALALRESDQNVTEVAESLGYGDVYFFSQQFKKIMGLSPLNYARQPKIADA